MKPNFLFEPISGEMIEAMSRWQYPPPYDIYNGAPIESQADIDYFFEPNFAYHQIRSGSSGALVGFCSFGEDAQVRGGDYNNKGLDVGMGLRPDLIGQGMGSKVFVNLLDFANLTFEPQPLRATIAAFNTRAQALVTRVGFVETECFERSSDKKTFIIFVKRNFCSVT